jgi:hypothetical protein
VNAPSAKLANSDAVVATTRRFISTSGLQPIAIDNADLLALASRLQNALITVWGMNTTSPLSSQADVD